LYNKIDQVIDGNGGSEEIEGVGLELKIRREWVEVDE
jgi:hypothetical protein